MNHDEMMERQMKASEQEAKAKIAAQILNQNRVLIADGEYRPACAKIADEFLSKYLAN